MSQQATAEIAVDHSSPTHTEIIWQRRREAQVISKLIIDLIAQARNDLDGDNINLTCLLVSLAIKASGPCTAPQIARAAGLPKTNVRRALKALVDNQSVTRNGNFFASASDGGLDTKTYAVLLERALVDLLYRFSKK